MAPGLSTTVAVPPGSQPQARRALGRAASTHVDAAAAQRYLRTHRRRHARNAVSRVDPRKRAFDLALVLAASPVLLPVMGAIALLIRLDSKGPALFYQRRYGLGGNKFTMIKFRTMDVDAHEALADHLAVNTQHAFEWSQRRKLKDDPRVTRVGRFLRRTSLDELPQVINVLRGDMSLVGPRPLPMCERHPYGKAFALYCRALPGLTGLWQVSGRSDLPYEKRIELDTFYIRQRSVKLDLAILARTVKAVLSKRGAY